MIHVGCKEVFIHLTRPCFTLLEWSQSAHEYDVEEPIVLIVSLLSMRASFDQVGLFVEKQCLFGRNYRDVGFFQFTFYVYYFLTSETRKWKKKAMLRNKLLSFPTKADSDQEMEDQSTPFIQDDNEV